MNTLANRVNERMGELGLTQEALADLVGVSQVAIGKICRGETKRPRVMHQLAKALHTTTDWLVEGTGQKVVALPGLAPDSESPVELWEDPTPREGFIMCKKVLIHASAGNGGYSYETLENAKPMMFSVDWANRRGVKEENLIAMYARGDSMEPTISNGASIVVDMAQTSVSEGKLYVIVYGSDVRVKRLYSLPDGGLRIVSDNHYLYPPIELTPAQTEHIRVIGRVIWRAGDL
jgi:phage repressor protein C with HTH and peptisase S24 domain